MHRDSTSGFSLIEILVAMALLVLLVTVSAMIYSATEDAWTIGTTRGEADRSGQNAVRMLRNDLQSAIAGTNLTFILRPDRDTNLTCYGLDNDELCMVTLTATAGGSNRVGRAIHYYVDRMPGIEGSNRFQLVRAVATIAADAGTGHLANAYWNPSWYEDFPLGGGRPSDATPAALNISAFLVGAVDEDGNAWRWMAFTNSLPRAVDIFLETMSDRAALQAADMTAHGLTPTNFVEQNARRFSTRVFLMNSEGYRPR